MVEVSAPGKLFFSGEWAVLEVGNPGLVASVNKRVHAKVEAADEYGKIVVSIRDFDLKDLKAEFDGKELKWERELTEKEQQDTKFMKASIETALRYVGIEKEDQLKPFKIDSWGELSQITLEDGETKKIGFGSSAASVVAAVAGVLKFYSQDIESKQAKDVIYKLSAMTHYFAQGKVGSAFDVAASTYGGIFVYQRFDPKWLGEQIESGKSVKEIAEMDWPSFKAETLEIPEGFRLLIGWTKESASTSAMVKQLNAWAESNKDEYKRLYDQIADLVRELIPEWKAKNKDRIIDLLRKNEDYLRELGQASGVNIETEGLKLLSEIAKNNNAAGKLSGAGGGDCGIGVCFDDQTAEKIKADWEKNGFHMVDATIDHDGIKVEG
jgi:phosphomevalonate kinase